MNPVVKAGFAFTLCNVLQRGIQFLITPIYTRVLSTEQYGEYSAHFWDAEFIGRILL